MTAISSKIFSGSGLNTGARSKAEIEANFDNVVESLKSEPRPGNANGSLTEQVANIEKTILDAVGSAVRGPKSGSLIADMQGAVAKNPDLRAKASELFGRLKSGLDFGAYLERTGGDVDEASRLYALDANFLNYVLGSNGRPLDENLTICIAGVEIKMREDVGDIVTSRDREEELLRRQRLVGDADAA